MVLKYVEVFFEHFQSFFGSNRIGADLLKRINPRSLRGDDMPGRSYVPFGHVNVTIESWLHDRSTITRALKRSPTRDCAATTKFIGTLDYGTILDFGGGISAAKPGPVWKQKE